MDGNGRTTPYGPYGPLPDLPGVRRGLRGGLLGRLRRRRGCGCLALLALLGLVSAGFYLLADPWALHIGGRFTPLGDWQGYGAVSASNGGRYELYLSLQADQNPDDGGDCSGYGCDTLGGSAQLCTESGVSYTLAIRGGVASWWSTDGAATSVEIYASGPLPGNYPDADFDIALKGVWHGPALDLSDPDGYWTEVLTPRGGLRTELSTANLGTATTVIRYGGSAAFDAACQRLAS